MTEIVLSMLTELELGELIEHAITISPNDIYSSLSGGIVDMSQTDLSLLAQSGQNCNYIIFDSPFEYNLA